MPTSLPLDLSNLRAGIADLYGGTGHVAAQLRAAQLSSILRLTPYAMLANFGSGVLVAWRLATHTFRSAASKVTMAGCGTVRFQKV